MAGPGSAGKIRRDFFVFTGGHVFKLRGIIEAHEKAAWEGSWPTSPSREHAKPVGERYHLSREKGVFDGIATRDAGMLPAGNGHVPSTAGRAP
jgi:hypothetical protein